MIPFIGWNKIEVMQTLGLHPESKNSNVINVASNESFSKIYATLMLWKKSGEKWRKKELIPLKSIKISKDFNQIFIKMKNGSHKTINLD
jgi:hypothetical protein